MKFDLISDFHVEQNTAYKDTRGWTEGEPVFFAWHKAKTNPVLVMAGDLSNSHLVSMAIVEEAADYYDHVVWCDGNHEHYSGYLDNTKYNLMNNMERFRVQADRDLENVTFLNGETFVKFDGTMFVGANGWYDFRFAHGYTPKQQRQEWHLQSNDPVCIRFGKKNRPERMADRQARQIAKIVEEAQDDDSIREIVVVTHTIPHRDGLIKDMSHEWYKLNGAYGNMHMSKVRLADTKDKITTWCFGHTHWLYDYFAEGINYVANPRGYHGEKKWAKHTPNGLVFSGIREVDTNEQAGSAFGTVESETD